MSRMIAGWKGVASSASSGFVRSAASVYWIRSFVPMLKKSTSGAIVSATSASAGTSTMTPIRISDEMVAPSARA